MRGPKPNRLYDELDALLDGRPVELAGELVPLAQAADALRAELDTYRLDPEVADRHLERTLDGSATVVPMPVPMRAPMPGRPQPNGWDLRRRVAAVVLAAALVLAPATVASAASLPGQAMYPLKLAIEQLRLVSVQWSPTLEAIERTRVADERLDELERLLDLRMFNQVGPAVTAATRAVMAAQNAVAEARREGAAGSELAKLTGQLGAVRNHAVECLEMVAATLEAAQLPAVSDSTRKAIETAVDDSTQVLSPHQDRETPTPGGTGTSTQTTAPSQPGASPSSTADPTPGPQPSTSTPTSPTDPPESTAPPTTTKPSTTNPPTTNTPTTVTTGAPPGSGGETPDSQSMAEDRSDAAEDRSDVGAPPPTIPNP
jgi:hypothetical protein